MDFPTIRSYFSGLFRRLPGVAPTSFVDGSRNHAEAAAADGHQEGSPFVLVAHSAGGQWEVYATDFERPLASFDGRQAGCDFANSLAKNRKDAIVLIRESQGFQ